MTIWRMHVSCCITKATHTHTHTRARARTICSTYCLSSATMVARSHLHVPSNVRYLSCYTLPAGDWMKVYGACYSITGYVVAVSVWQMALIIKRPRCVAYTLLFVPKLKLKTIKVYRTVGKTILSQQNGLTVILNWIDCRRSVWNSHVNQDRCRYSCLYHTMRSLRDV